MISFSKFDQNNIWGNYPQNGASGSYTMLILKKALACVGMLVAFGACGDDVKFMWDMPMVTTNMAGIKMYAGFSPSPALSNSTAVVIISATNNTMTLANIPPGVVYFQATAFLTGGFESVPSNDVAYTNRHFGPINLRIVP